MQQQFSINDFVWAKLQKYPPWPAIILEPGVQTPSKPSKLCNEPLYWVFFFGTHNYSWIEKRYIKDYKEYKDKFVALYKMASFKESVQEIDQFIEKTEKDPTYKIPIKDLVNKNTFITKSTTKRLRVEINKLDMEYLNVSHHPKKSKTKEISSNSLKFGIIGVENIGNKIATNFINSGQKFNIWDQLPHTCDDLQLELDEDKKFSVKCISPQSVISNSEIIFVCITDYKIVRTIIQNSCRMISTSENIMKDKGLIKIGGISPENAKEIENMVVHRGGRYLEAYVQEGDPNYCGGKVLILTAGDNSLFVDCQAYFRTFTFKTVYLGDVGYASKLHLILQMIQGVVLSGLAEGLNLLERCGLNVKDFVDIFKLTTLNSILLNNKIDNILEKKFKITEQSLQHFQNDMELGLEIANEQNQPMLMTTTANQMFKHCVRLGYGNYDPISIFMRNNH